MNINSINDLIVTNKKLGYGGWADVYWGHHKKTNIPLAIKEIDMSKIHPKDLNNINREITYHKNLKNEYIIKLYEHFKIGKKLILILEYADNGNLFNYIYKNNLDNKKIAKIIYESVCGLEYIHSKNLLHRDIKPENLLLSSNFKIKLSDFGWCAKYSKTDLRTSYCGTLEYMAPEILENIPQDFKIDIWSIGVLLFELIHKKSPFKSNNPNQMINMIKNKNYNFHKEINLDAKDLIMKILCYNKNDRLSLKEIKNHPFIWNNYKKDENRFKNYLNNKIFIDNDFQNNDITYNQINSWNKQNNFKFFNNQNLISKKVNNNKSNFNKNGNFCNSPMKTVSKIIRVTTSVDKNSYNYYNQKFQNNIHYKKEIKTLKPTNNRLSKDKHYINSTTNFKFIPYNKPHNIIN